MAWIDQPLQLTADRPLDAATTVVAQGNLQAVYDASGSDLGGGCLVDGYWEGTPASAIDWEWMPWISQPVRALRTQGDLGWRSITLELLALTVADGDVDVRMFVLPRPSLALDPATGLVSDFEKDDASWTSSTAGREDMTVAPTEAGWTPIAGQVVPIVWVKLAYRGTDTIRIYDHRWKEGT